MEEEETVGGRSGNSAGEVESVREEVGNSKGRSGTSEGRSGNQ